ncbi:exopolysaccharide biosynthesis protein [Rubellimicrobium roseum]|uniref:Exopolysaccharide biosynthesis protein n=1 Tax=Rubellimicrobium roseum TaxID=687525 RepID=A0A5C4NB53_9RHOB|nr:exopolysaccharide biosynthesis protein [Rubellimicrobium roseum]TNC66628.1 exopolysaccharide biosynthesis protein [Rubellimicrobium roseum]
MADEKGVEQALDRLHETGEDKDKVSVGDVVEALGDRGYGPLLFVPALIEISPIGGIPAVPSILALIIALFAVQIALGREKMWLPGFLRNLSVTGDRMKRATDKLQPVARWLDRWFHGRLEWLASDKVLRVAAVLIVFLCLSVPPLELLPFASTAPMAAIASFGLAMTLRDGLLMALGFALSLATVAVGFGLIGGG